METRFRADRIRPRWGGATAIGARFFLIADNVNIPGVRNPARRIALNLRESGRGPVAPDRLNPGKGTGGFVDEYDLVQVMVSLSDRRSPSIHPWLEEAKHRRTATHATKVGGKVR